MKKYVLGVDIGFVNTGISLFEIIDGKAKLRDVCLINTEKSDKKKKIRAADDDIRRICQIAREFYEFYTSHVNNEDKIVVFGEAPTGGAQSAKANRAMGIATAIPAVIFELLNIPVEYVTPTDVKLAVTGKRNAGKLEIMNKIIKMVGGETSGDIITTGGKERNMIKYHLCGKKFGNNFEHIADSIGTIIHGRKESILYRMLVDGKDNENNFIRGKLNG